MLTAAQSARRAQNTAATVAVCEVSSFQAETFRHFHADETLWTNLAEDHLERHLGMGAYFDAKLRLVHSTRTVTSAMAHRAA